MSLISKSVGFDLEGSGNRRYPMSYFNFVALSSY